MPTKLKPTLVTNFRGVTKVTNFYIKNTSEKELRACAESVSNTPKMRAKARKELSRRGLV